MKKNKKNKLQILNTLFFIAGIILFVLLIKQLKPTEVFLRLKTVGWYFIVAFALHGITLLTSTAAWQAVIDKDKSNATYLKLAAAFWYGHTINFLTPAATLGEVSRFSMLKDKVDSSELVASLISFNFFTAVSQQIFNLLGPFLALAVLNLPGNIMWLVAGLSIVMLIPSMVIFIFIKKGAILKLAHLVCKIPLLKGYADPLSEKAIQVDSAIHNFMKRPADVKKALFWTLLARLAGPLEVWMLMLIFLPEHSYVELFILSLAVQTTGQLISWIMAIVPGQIGVAEGGFALLFNLLHFDPLAGFSIQLIRRLRMIPTVFVGLTIGLFTILGRKKDS